MEGKISKIIEEYFEIDLNKYHVDVEIMFREKDPIIKNDYRETSMPQKVIFPKDSFPFPNETLELHIPSGQDFFTHESSLKWSVFLDNAPPCRGEFDLREVLNKI